MFDDFIQMIHSGYSPNTPSSHPLSTKSPPIIFFCYRFVACWVWPGPLPWAWVWSNLLVLHHITEDHVPPSSSSHQLSTLLQGGCWPHELSLPSMTTYWQGAVLCKQLQLLWVHKYNSHVIHRRQCYMAILPIIWILMHSNKPSLLVCPRLWKG